MQNQSVAKPVVVSVRGAAALCGLSVRTIRRLVRDGTFPAHYRDGVLGIALADVDAWKQIRFYGTGTRRPAGPADAGNPKAADARSNDAEGVDG